MYIITNRYSVKLMRIFFEFIIVAAFRNNFNYKIRKGYDDSLNSLHLPYSIATIGSANNQIELKL